MKAKNKIDVQYKCGHSGKLDYYSSMQGNLVCKACKQLTGYFASCHITDPQVLLNLSKLTYTKTGRIRPLDQVLAEMQTIAPELVPICAAKEGVEHDWARHLLAGTKPGRATTRAAMVSEALRKEIKASYPHLKPRIHSNNYSGGNSVDVKLPPSTSEAELRAIDAMTKRYERGKFDSSTDMYVCDNIDRSIPQVDYVFVSKESL